MMILCKHLILWFLYIYHLFIQVPHIAAGGKSIVSVCLCHCQCLCFKADIKIIPISSQIISTLLALRKLYYKTEIHLRVYSNKSSCTLLLQVAAETSGWIFH